MYRMRSHDDDSDGPELNDDEYEEMIKELQTEYRKAAKEVETRHFWNNWWRKQEEEGVDG